MNIPMKIVLLDGHLDGRAAGHQPCGRTAHQPNSGGSPQPQRQPLLERPTHSRAQQPLHLPANLLSPMPLRSSSCGRRRPGRRPMRFATAASSHAEGGRIAVDPDVASGSPTASDMTGSRSSKPDGTFLEYWGSSGTATVSSSCGTRYDDAYGERRLRARRVLLRPRRRQPSSPALRQARNVPRLMGRPGRAPGHYVEPVADSPSMPNGVVHVLDVGAQRRRDLRQRRRTSSARSSLACPRCRRGRSGARRPGRHLRQRRLHAANEVGKFDPHGTAGGDHRPRGELRETTTSSTPSPSTPPAGCSSRAGPGLHRRHKVEVYDADGAPAGELRRLGSATASSASASCGTRPRRARQRLRHGRRGEPPREVPAAAAAGAVGADAQKHLTLLGVRGARFGARRATRWFDAPPRRSGCTGSKRFIGVGRCHRGARRPARGPRAEPGGAQLPPRM